MLFVVTETYLQLADSHKFPKTIRNNCGKGKIVYVNSGVIYSSCLTPITTLETLRPEQFAYIAEVYFALYISVPR